MGCGQAYAYLERALTGNAIEVALGKDAERLAQVSQVCVANAGGKLKLARTTIPFVAGVQGVHYMF